MATVRDGERSALLVVDAQVGVMEGCLEPGRIAANIARAVDLARSKGWPVVWVQHEDAHLVHGSPSWEWVEELTPFPGEPRIFKRFNSSFEATDLEAQLARLGICRIVLAGAATIACIRATAYAALDRGYDLTLLQDAHTTFPLPPLEDGTRIEAADIIRELNVTMNWLSYPGRTSRAIAVDALA